MPSLRRAQECSKPAVMAIWTIVLVSVSGSASEYPESAVSTVAVVSVSRPPSRVNLLPQQSSPPSVGNAQAWESPALTATKVPLGGWGSLKS